MESKESFRKRFKAVRNRLSTSRRLEAKESAAQIACSDGLVLSFASLPNEIDTSKLNQRLLSEGRLALPAIENDHLVCRRVENLAHLKKGRFGISESICEIVPPEKISFALIPGLVFDHAGMRIGHGFGFYDRLLPHLSKKVGLCFKEQLIEGPLPHDPWDVYVERVVAL